MSESPLSYDDWPKPLDRRTRYAQALLHVLQNPDGVETLDWQLADAAMAVADIELINLAANFF